MSVKPQHVEPQPVESQHVESKPGAPPFPISSARPDLQKSASNRFMYAVLLVMAAGMLLLASAGYRTGHVPQQDPGQPAQARIG